MKSKTLIIGNILLFAIGLVITLMSGRSSVMDNLLFVTGLLFVVPGVINVFMLLGKKNDTEKKPSGAKMVAGWVSSAAAIILGSMIMITPDTFAGVFLYIIGALIIIYAVALIYVMAVMLKKVNLPKWMYALPVAVLVDGCILFCLSKNTNPRVLALMLGLGLLVISVSYFITLIAVGSYNRGIRKEQEAKEATSTAVTKQD